MLSTPNKRVSNKPLYYKTQSEMLPFIIGLAREVKAVQKQAGNRLL